MLRVIVVQGGAPTSGQNDSTIREGWSGKTDCNLLLSLAGIKPGPQLFNFCGVEPSHFGGWLDLTAACRGVTTGSQVLLSSGRKGFYEM